MPVAGNRQWWLQKQVESTTICTLDQTLEDDDVWLEESCFYSTHLCGFNVGGDLQETNKLVIHYDMKQPGKEMSQFFPSLRLKMQRFYVQTCIDLWQ